VRQLVSPLAVVLACGMLALPRLAVAQPAPAISPAISTPDKVEPRLGTLEFKDGAPSAATVAKIYDNLDFTHAFCHALKVLLDLCLRHVVRLVLVVECRVNFAEPNLGAGLDDESLEAIPIRFFLTIGWRISNS
jgi:hypothetical protein